MINGYSEVYNFGHKAVSDIFKSEVTVEEKVDGSQFSFGRIDGKYFCRSKGKDQTGPTDKLFLRAKAGTENLPLNDGWIYRGECIDKPKHNTLVYERVPNNHVIIYDIDTADQCYLTYVDKKAEAERIGLECVPLLFSGKVEKMDELKDLLNGTSVLGGSMEGIVIKAYDQFDQRKKVVMAKIVRDDFKEKHSREWKNSNPSGLDKIGQIAQEFCTEARWRKAIEHLRDNGQLAGDVTDIGNLLKEIQLDMLKECKDEILDKLWKWAWPHIGRAATRGFPEWYKARLLETVNLEEIE